MKVKIKDCWDALEAKVAATPRGAAFLRKRDQLSEWLRLGILSFFDTISPILIILCLNKPKPDKNNGSAKGPTTTQS